MSTLLEETDEYLLLERYIHDESDSYSRWEQKRMPPTDEYPWETNAEKYSSGIHLAEHYAFMEIRCVYKIYKDSTPENPHVEYVSFDDMLIIPDEEQMPDTREILRGIDHHYVETEKTPGLCVCGYLQIHERHV